MKIFKLIQKFKKSLCPLGGDENNGCDGCCYSGDYKFDKKSKECLQRK